LSELPRVIPATMSLLNTEATDVVKDRWHDRAKADGNLLQGHLFASQALHQSASRHDMNNARAAITAPGFLDSM
jgi:hypothetical protein